MWEYGRWVENLTKGDMMKNDDNDDCLELLGVYERRRRSGVLLFPEDFPTKLEAGSCLLFPAVWTTPAVGGRLDNITFSLLYGKYTGLYNPLTCSCLRAEGDEVTV